jgi:hypothetical protein
MAEEMIYWKGVNGGSSDGVGSDAGIFCDCINGTGTLDTFSGREFGPWFTAEEPGKYSL